MAALQLLLVAAGGVVIGWSLLGIRIARAAMADLRSKDALWVDRYFGLHDRIFYCLIPFAALRRRMERKAAV